MAKKYYTPMAALSPEEQAIRRLKNRVINQRFQSRHPHRVRLTKPVRPPRASLSEEEREHLRAQQRATRIPRAQMSPDALARERELDHKRYPRRKQLTPEQRIKRNAQQLLRKHANLEASRAYDALRHRQYRAEDPEKYRLAARKSNAKHRDKRNAAQRVRQQANREILLPKMRLRSQQNYQAHKPAYHARSAKWRRENPEKLRALEARRRARKRNAPVNDFTATQWRTMCKAAGYLCAYCKKKFAFKALTQDHITPLSRGGSHTLSNIIPACLSCNSRKHAKDVPVPVQPWLLLPEVDDAAAD